MFRGLPELQHLDLYGNKLNCIANPSDILLLSKLEYLDVGYNQLTEIPNEWATLQSLKTLKCMNNLIEVVPAAICETDVLRVLDVSSNPLVQPPLETCERGLHSMRRYYHCLKLEEMAGPDFQQQNKQSKYMFKKTKPKILQKKKKKTAFPASLCRTSMFRNVSEPSAGSFSPALSSGESQFQEPLPIRSVSFSISSREAGSIPLTMPRNKSDPSPAKFIPEQEIYYSDGSGSVTSDTEEPIEATETQADEITVNDTLKVIFVGMAMSGKTSIIKRLIEGKDAKIPQKDERTIGVDIYEWDPNSAGDYGPLDTQIPLDGELESRMNGNVDVKFSVWDFAGQHVYHATHELFFSSQSLYVLVWDMGANNISTTKRRTSLNEVEQGAFKLTYDSSDEEDDFFSSDQETRRATRALEQDIDEKLQFWYVCVMYICMYSLATTFRLAYLRYRSPEFT